MRKILLFFALLNLSVGYSQDSILDVYTSISDSGRHVFIDLGRLGDMPEPQWDDSVWATAGDRLGFTVDNTLQGTAFIREMVLTVVVPEAIPDYTLTDVSLQVFVKEAVVGCQDPSIPIEIVVDTIFPNYLTEPNSENLTKEFEFSYDYGDISENGLMPVFDDLVPNGLYQIKLRMTQAFMDSICGAVPDDANHFNFFGPLDEEEKRPHFKFYYEKNDPPACTGLVVDSIVQDDVAGCLVPSSGFTVYTCGEHKPYQFSLDGGVEQTDSTFTNLCPGDYTITITDTLGTSLDTTFTLAGEVFVADSVKFSESGCAAYRFSFSDCPGDLPFAVGILDNATGDTLWSGVNFDDSPIVSASDYSIFFDHPCDSTEALFSLPERENEISYEFVRMPTCDSLFSDLEFDLCTDFKPLLFSLDGSPLQLDSVFTEVPNGDHEIIIVNANDDSTIATISILDVELEILNIEITPDLCGGTSTITADLCGGKPDYKWFIISGTDTVWTQDAENLVAPNIESGSYQLVVKGGQGQEAVENIVVNPSNGFSGVPTAEIVPPTCNTSADGEIVFTNTEPNLQFSINGGAVFSTNKIFKNLTSGSYQLLMKLEDCVSDTVDIYISSDYDLDLISVQSIRFPSCSPTNDGVVELKVEGGEAPFQYFVGNVGVATPEIKVVPGDTNMVYYVIDANGCTSDSITLSIPYTGKIAIDSVAITHPTCDPFEDGSIEVTAIPGKNPLKILWVGDPGYGTNFLKEDLPDTTLRYVVSDANSCFSDTGTVTLAYTNKLRLLPPAVTSVGCLNDSTGVVSLMADGGDPFNYQYSFNNGTDYSAQSDSTGVFEGDALQVKARSGACESDMILVTMDSVPSVDTTSVVVVDASCPGDTDGEITINITGAKGEVLYSIDGGATQSTGVFKNLAYKAGGYNVEVHSDDPCGVGYPQQRMITTFKVFMQSQGGVTMFGYSREQVTCYDGDDGKISINASSVAMPLQYSIDNGQTYVDTNIIEDLSPGFYQILVKDNQGCKGDRYGVFIENPQRLQFGNSTFINPDCFGSEDGQITVGAYGESGQFNYSIDGGDTYQSSKIFNNLTGGVYNIIVADTNGCDTISTPIELEGPDSLYFNVKDVILPNCLNPIDGEISLTGVGGESPYVYELDGGGIEPSGVFTDLAPGEYVFRVRDINACRSVWDTVVMPEPNIDEADSLHLVHISCFGENDGRAFIIMEEGQGVQYAIDAGGFGSTPAFFNLHKGAHEYRIKNAAGCVSEWIPFEIEEPEELTLDIDSVVKEIICFGDSAILQFEAAGGRSPYEYNFQQTFLSRNDSGLFVGKKGAFEAWVKDVNGCKSTVQNSNISGPNPFVFDPFVIHQTQGANGRIIFNVTGGTNPLEYRIEGGVFSDNNIFEDLVKGDYMLYVRDANGCQDSIEVEVLGPVGVEDFSKRVVQVVPNPSTGVYHILGIQGNAQWTVVDMAGRKVKAGKGVEVNLSTLANGSYVIMFEEHLNLNPTVLIKMKE